jgi:hypothetical protein
MAEKKNPYDQYDWGRATTSPEQETQIKKPKGKEIDLSQDTVKQHHISKETDKKIFRKALWTTIYWQLTSKPLIPTALFVTTGLFFSHSWSLMRKYPPEIAKRIGTASTVTKVTIFRR